MFGSQKPKGSTKDLVHGTVPEPEPPRSDGGKAEKKSKKIKGKKEHRNAGGLLRNKALWGCLCLVAGFLVAFVAVPAIQKQAAALTPVVKLTADAPAGTRLTSDMLAVVEIGAGGVPRNAVTDIADATGKYMTVTGLADDILTAVRLSSQYPTNDPELLTLPAGKVAMAVALDSLEQSVASKLRTGDVIQLFAVFQDTPGGMDNTAVEGVMIPALQAVEVLSVTNASAIDVTDQGNIADGNDDRQITTVVLAVNQQQAAALSGLSANARLHAALVVRGDNDAKRAALAAQDGYFEALEEMAPEEGEEGIPAEEPLEEEQPDGGENA